MLTREQELEEYDYWRKEGFDQDATQALVRAEEAPIDEIEYDYLVLLLEAGYPVAVAVDETFRRAGMLPAVNKQDPMWPVFGMPRPSPKTMWATGERPLPTGNGKEYASYYLKRMARAIQHTRHMPANARKVGVVLFNEAAKHGNRNMLGASTWLASLTDLSTDQCDRAVAWLQRAGWLKVVKNGKTMVKLDSKLARYRYTLPSTRKPRFIHLQLQPPTLPDNAGVAA